MNLCPRDSVGLILWNDHGEVLMMERLKYPIGLACAAGHLEFIDQIAHIKELFDVAGKREANEELGITIVDMKLVLQETFPNPCKGGFDGHVWEVYEVTRWEGEPRLMEPDKHGFVRWMSGAEIQKWRRDGKPVDPAWFTYIFPELAKTDPRYRALLL